jgi:uncharacterized membrane protein
MAACAEAGEEEGPDMITRRASLIILSPAAQFGKRRCQFESMTLQSSAMPTWALALAYWLHLLATVIWVGGITLLALLVWPGAQARWGHSPEAGRFLRDLNQRFNPWAWISLAVLTGTGLFQMAADSNYHGFLTIDSGWAGAMLLKHLAVIGMAGIGAALQWIVQPELARLALLEERGKPAPHIAAMRKRERFLMRANLVCAALVLLCTAIATAL